MTVVQPGSGRAEIENVDGVLEIAVPVKARGFVIPFMIFWLTMWAIGEYTVSAQFVEKIQTAPLAGNVFTLVWLCLWTIAGPYALYQTLWLAFGTELMSLSLSQLEHSRKVLGITFRKRIYLVKDITKLRTAPAVAHKLRGKYERPLPDASSIAFDYGRSSIIMASGIDEAEADYIRSEMVKYSRSLALTSRIEST